MKKINWDVLKYHFAESTYVSVVWEWFLVLTAKLADPFLLLSILYASMKLINPQMFGQSLDAFINGAQMIALDAAGVGLLTLAGRAEKEGRTDGVKEARRVGYTLLSLMIVSLAMSSLSSTFHIEPSSYDWLVGIILVVRAVLAVCYRMVVVKFKPEKQQAAVVRSVDVLTKMQEMQAATNLQFQQITEAHQQSQSFQNGQVLKLAERLQHIETGLQYTFSQYLQSTELKLQTSITEALHTLEKNLQLSETERVASVIERLQHIELNLHLLKTEGLKVKELTSVIEGLAILPELNERVGELAETAQYQLGTVTREFQQVRITVEQQVNTPPQWLEQVLNSHQQQIVVAKPAPLQIAERRTEGGENKSRKAFVFACLQEDPDMSIPDIQKRATEQGLPISVGSISTYRKAFQSSLKVVETEGSMETESEPSTEKIEAIAIGN